MKSSQHAMTSEVASQKKKSGHAREQVRLSQLGEGSEIIKGTGKADIRRHDGLFESVKGGKKTQWALYTIDRVTEDRYFTQEENEVLQKWVDFIPTDKDEWVKNRSFYSLNPNAANLFEVFKNNPMKLINYFCGVDVIDYLVTLDSRTNTWEETSMEVFADKINNAIKDVYFTPGGKFVISGGEKNTILFELELRKGKSVHKRLLFHSILHRIIDCIK
jgi:hypothetical protein